RPKPRQHLMSQVPKELVQVMVSGAKTPLGIPLLILGLEGVLNNRLLFKLSTSGALEPAFALAVPQPSESTDIVADDVVHKEGGDSFVRATTTASCLEAEQDIARSSSGSPYKTITPFLIDNVICNNVCRLTRLRNLSSLSLGLPRRDLQLTDEDGIDCLLNTTIFENLALMGYEKVSERLTFYISLFSHQ
nr:hypothetical protein [Tanacetum cinerariifolium]